MQALLGNWRPKRIAHQSLTAARVHLAAHELDAASDLLARALECLEETGARVIEPFVRVEMAELARLRGDDAVRRAELAAAQQLFTQFDAPDRAATIAAKLAA